MACIALLAAETSLETAWVKALVAVAEACKILLLLVLCTYVRFVVVFSVEQEGMFPGIVC